jgi:hypothetical protein
MGKGLKRPQLGNGIGIPQWFFVVSWVIFALGYSIPYLIKVHIDLRVEWRLP